MENNEDERFENSDDELEQQVLAIVKKALPALRFVKNTAKALHRLSSVGTDTLVAALQAKTSGFQLQKTRNKLLIAQLAELPKGQTDIGVKVADRLIQEQHRIDQLVFAAIERIQDSENSESSGEGEVQESGDEIGDDWLECFRSEAAVRTQGEMRETFARILAGEISQPGKFSIRTLRTVGALDQSTASLFRKAASLRVGMEIVVQDAGTGPRIHIFDARIPSLGGELGYNFLKNKGLGYDQLIELTENGLLNSDYDSWGIYNQSILHPQNGQQEQIIPLVHQNQNWVLMPLPKNKATTEFNIQGALFTKVGQELLHIVDIEKDTKFLEKVRAYLRGQHVEMVPFSPESI